MANPVVNLAQNIVESKSYDYNGYNITFNKGENLMINASEMAKAFGKLPSGWLRNQSVQEFIKELSAMRNCIASDLVQVINGDNGGTWMHEDVAMEFARWLSPAFAIWCNDRIKELLQVGMTATPATLEAMLANPDLVIGLATQVKELRAENELKDKVIAEREAKIEEDAPKVLFAEAVETSDSVCLVGELAKILKQNGVKNMGQNRLYKWLRSHSFLGNKGDNYNLPTQKAMDLGVFKVIKGKRIDRHTGGVIVTRTAKVTTKGLKYFINKFINSAAVL